MANLTVTIITKNSKKYLDQCLGALKSFPEVILVDSGSTDSTLSIAEKFKNVKVLKQDFLGYGPQKNFAANHASNDWIFSVDSDEIPEEDLLAEIKSLSLREGVVFSIKRKNFFNNKWIKGCGWHPDRVVRIYNRKEFSFNHNLVHESVQINGDTLVFKLDHSLIHYPYAGASDFIQKMDKYTHLYSVGNKEKKASGLKAISRSIATFVKSYFFQRGFLYGFEGLLISYCHANSVFYKYAKIYEAKKKNPG